MVLAVLIFLFTLVLVIWQPKLRWQPGGLGIGWSATLGPLLALLSGVVSVADIPVVWDIVWNATITFVALIIISLILDEAGFFKWAALSVSRLALRQRVLSRTAPDHAAWPSPQYWNRP